VGVPRRDDIERGSTLLHCFLAEGACGGIGLLETLTALEPLADRLATSSSEAVGQHAPTAPLTVSS
jgi:hypothetical protein